MKKELELKLVKNYSQLLKDHDGDPKVTGLAWGMECGDGWYYIIDEALHLINQVCIKFEHEDIAVAQIKEKYGQLRIYMTYGECSNDDVWMMIECITEAALQKSRSCCELTGKYGVLCKRGSWVKTLSFEAAQDCLHEYEPANEYDKGNWEQRKKRLQA